MLSVKKLCKDKPFLMKLQVLSVFITQISRKMAVRNYLQPI